MEEITQQLVEEFGFRARSIRKSKYMYICRSEKEARAVRLTSQSPEQIMFAEAVKARLIENGFKNVDKYYISSQGTPFFTQEDKIYVMTDHTDYPEADFSDSQQIKEIMKTAGLIHKLGSGTDYEYSGDKKNVISPQSLEKGIKRLKAVKKIVCERKKYSDFDIIFIKNYDSYMKQAQEAFEALEKSEIRSLIKEGEERKLFCHNLLKEENLLRTEKGIYVSGFDCACRGHYIYDLYQLTERYIRKHTGNMAELTELIKIYSAENEDDERIYPVLYALLMFPFRFIKLCDGFYSKKRSWVPNSVREQFKETIALKDESREYVSCLLKK